MSSPLSSTIDQQQQQKLKIQTTNNLINNTTITNNNNNNNNDNPTPNTTGRLRLPLSTLRSLDRRSSISSLPASNNTNTNTTTTTTTTTTTPTTSTTTTTPTPTIDHPSTANSITDQDSQEHQLLLQRRGSASDINIGLNRARAPSLAAIQERIARMKPDLINQSDSSTPTTTTPTISPELILSSITHHSPEKSIPEKQDNINTPNNQPTTDQQQQQPIQDLHPLQHSWTLYFDTRLSNKRSSTSAHHTTGGQAYEAGLQPIGTFQSVEQFCSYFNWTVIPSQMDMNSSVQLFKAHIKPMWEDPANSKGGKWTITMKSNSNLALLDKLWTYLVLGLVGEQIETSPSGIHQDEDFVCGAIVATRPRGNRIQIWVKEKDNVEKINGLGKRLISVLEINDHSGVSVEFSAHSGGSHGASKFISIQGGHANTSSPQSRGPNNSSQTPLIRPALEGMVIGGMGRGMEEKAMGVTGGGGGGGLMRRSTSVEVSQLGSGRMGVIPPTGSAASFGGGGPGFRGGGIAAGQPGGRGSQFSSLDPPIQNGVWRPNPSAPGASIARPPGMPTGPPGMMAAFVANNRRPQSALALPTLGSLNNAGATSHTGTLGSFKQTTTTNTAGPTKSRQPSPAPATQTSTSTSSITTPSASTNPNPRSSTSPAPPAPLGLGILSGS